jgi:hypothetical protein
MRLLCCLYTHSPATTSECLLDTSSPKEGAVGEQQREKQPTRNEGRASLKPEEASRPIRRCVANREGDRRRHSHATSGKKKWRYACRGAVRKDECEVTYESRKRRPFLGNGSVNARDAYTQYKNCSTRCVLCGPCRIKYLLCIERKVGLHPVWRRVEYLHRSPASCKRRQTENPLPGGITRPPCSWGI